MDKVLELLQTARRELIDDIARLSPDTFTFGFANTMAKRVNQLLEEFSNESGFFIEGQTKDFFNFGINSVEEQAKLANVPHLTFRIPQQLAKVAASDFTSLITGLSQSAGGRIQQRIRLGALKGETPFQVQKAISQMFKSIEPRAETIVRTEMLKLVSHAQYASMQQVEDAVPGSRKMWIAVLDSRTRPSHRATHLQSQAMEDPFILKDPSSGAITAKLLYPRGPAPAGGEEAPPGEIINCRCVMASDFSQVTNPKIAKLRAVIPAQKIER